MRRTKVRPIICFFLSEKAHNMFWGLGLRVQGSGFRALGLGFSLIRATQPKPELTLSGEELLEKG